MNYLRPGIKRGGIAEDEEDLIIRLHRLLGNRWALIAKRLPGRTDNEIKNYWNSHLAKKLQGKSKTPCPSTDEKTIESHHPPMNTSSAGFVCDGQNNPSTSMQVENDDSLNFLMDFDISQLFLPDISNSNFLQIEGINEVPAEFGANNTSSSSHHLFSENEVLKENGMICDPLQTSLDMELMKVASFLDLED